ncbi:MAG: polyprenol monophosphomannose synthase [Planctomycetes bacterium]|nr:polyprenol monophosphomannose synthase [Planctomycetota bacterium]
MVAPFRPQRSCLVVLPTYNERENLEAVIAAIAANLVTDVLIVDDNSPDGTGELADRMAAEFPAVHVLHRPNKRGLGTAYIDGFRWGLREGFERLIQMDCDFSHDPADLPRLVDACETADLVIGSRYVDGGETPGWPASRRLLSRCANLYASAFLGRTVRDWTAGFRCVRSDVLARADLDRIHATGFSFQVQLTWVVKQLGGRIREVPVRFVDRRKGESKLDRSIALEALRLIPSLRFRA